MEEILVVLIQFLIEVIGQAIVQIPFDCACRLRESREQHAVAMSTLFLVVGGMVGVMSVAFLPGTLIQIPALRILNLGVTPLLGGAIGYRIAKWQAETRNPNVVPRYHFWYAFFFTLALAAVRLVYAKRGIF